VTFCHRHLQFV